MISIIDLGIGNIGSIVNMLNYLGYESTIVKNPNELEKANKIILPGVGSFDRAILTIKSRGLDEIISHKSEKEKIPILGICLGMQLLTNGSEEGSKQGLGLIDAETKNLSSRLKKLEKNIPVPHMGWNQVKKSKFNPLTKDIDIDDKFYFVHSYYVDCNFEKESILKTNYGFEFDAAFNKDNIFGVQFHPEKSHKYGMKIFKNFSKI